MCVCAQLSLYIYDICVLYEYKGAEGRLLLLLLYHYYYTHLVRNPTIHVTSGAATVTVDALLSLALNNSVYVQVMHNVLYEYKGAERN